MIRDDPFYSLPGQSARGGGGIDGPRADEYSTLGRPHGNVGFGEHGVDVRVGIVMGSGHCLGEGSGGADAPAGDEGAAHSR